MRYYKGEIVGMTAGTCTSHSACTCCPPVKQIQKARIHAACTCYVCYDLLERCKQTQSHLSILTLCERRRRQHHLEAPARSVPVATRAAAATGQRRQLAGLASLVAADIVLDELRLEVAALLAFELVHRDGAELFAQLLGHLQPHVHPASKSAALRTCQKRDC